MERMKLHEVGIDLWRVDVTRLLVGAKFLEASFMFQRRYNARLPSFVHHL